MKLEPSAIRIQEGIPWILMDVYYEKINGKLKITYRWQDYRKNLLRSLYTKINDNFRTLDELVEIDWKEDQVDVIYSEFEVKNE